jgi:hypothetical protein
LFLFVSHNSLSCFWVLLLFMTNCPIHSRERRSDARRRRPKADS